MAKIKPESLAKEGAEPTFEEALLALEEIVAQLEDGELTLSESLARYEAGVKHLQRCHTYLDETQRKIELLTGVDEKDAARTAPFDEGATSLDEKAAARGRRRSSTPE